jgi:hypothetical protein
MRAASFLVANGEGDCSIVVLGGDAGGLGPNVKRWLGQLQVDVPPPEEFGAFLERQERFTTAGGDDGVLVDLTALVPGGDGEAEAMLAAVISREGATVFVKLTGARALLQKERENFRRLCASLN